MIRIAVPREIHSGERRVAATPQSVLHLRKLGFEVAVQQGAGEEIDATDAAYQEAGATVVGDVRKLWSDADIVLKVRPPEQNGDLGVHEADLLREGGTLIGFIWPAQNRDLLNRLVARKATVLAMDCVPRITRAQKMDTLSAMANIAGYRAIIEAASHFSRFFGGQISAAGRIDPAKVLVIGAGVAGLSAIGAARALGAIVRAFDPRSATRDQVKSMGAEFLEVSVSREKSRRDGRLREGDVRAFLRAEMALFAAQAMEVDIIVTTALIPGKKAPTLITTGMVESMKPGSVVVDLAAEQGGNCAMTKPGEVVVYKGVTIIGYTDLPSRMSSMSSQLYGATLVAHSRRNEGRGRHHPGGSREPGRSRSARHLQGRDHLAPTNAPHAAPAARAGRRDQERHRSPRRRRPSRHRTAATTRAADRSAPAPSLPQL